VLVVRIVEISMQDKYMNNFVVIKNGRRLVFQKPWISMKFENKTKRVRHAEMMMV